MRHVQVIGQGAGDLVSFVEKRKETTTKTTVNPPFQFAAQNSPFHFFPSSKHADNQNNKHFIDRGTLRLFTATKKK